MQRPTRTSAMRCIQLFYRMAFAYLRENQSRGYDDLLPDGISLEHLAMDCVSKLFVLDESRRFSCFERLFEELDWKLIQEFDLKRSIRRVVFSVVNQHVFGGYVELKPTFQKRVHSIWSTLDHGYPFDAYPRNGTMWLSCGLCNENLPIMPPEVMEPKLRYRINNNPLMNHLIQTLLDVLQFQHEYRKEMPFPEIVYIVDTRMKAIHSMAEPVSQPVSRNEGIEVAFGE